VLIGAETLALVGTSVEVGAELLLELKGKREQITAYALVDVREAAERSHASRFVGRARELDQLAEAWDRALAGPCCEFVTIVGDPGVGKSRLVAEALRRMDARVVRGRCLSYGEGITYWPVIEVVKQLHARPDDEQAALAIGSLLGETEAFASTDEIAWAFRKLLEARAPLVVCFDDVQWGEETFLELVESTALLSTGTPFLLVCMARPELLDRRPAWPGVVRRLEPLPDDEASLLVEEALPEEVRKRVVRASGGNPLFLTEMAAFGATDGGDVEVPGTLRALLVARLDQLEAGERGVLERGAIEGELFHRRAVGVLLPDEAQLSPRLAALVRKELVRPEKPLLVGDDAFRFCHLLLRDCAYDALPKATRAELHERFALWLEEHGAELVEMDEIVGYHLEQACAYREVLGLPAEQSLVASARRRLTAAEIRAMNREDYPAALKLASRALALVPAGETDQALEEDRADSLAFLGDLDAALRSYAEASERAAAAGDHVAAASLRLSKETWASLASPVGGVGRLQACLDEVLPQIELSGNDRALYSAYWAAAHVAITRGQADRALPLAERSLAHAWHLPRHCEEGVRRPLLAARAMGSTPPSDLLAYLEQWEVERGRTVRSMWRAEALAMLGRFEEARTVVADIQSHHLERGNQFDYAQNALLASSVERLAGDLQQARSLLAVGCELIEQQHADSVLGDLAAEHAHVLCELDLPAEANEWVARAAELSDPADRSVQVAWRGAKARVLARRGNHAEAEQLAREAAALADETDNLNRRARSQTDLADVLTLAGRADEANTALRQALALYEQKGNVVMARRTEEQLASIQG
jgi:tetratricopeptide (TPR) repeat protein